MVSDAFAQVLRSNRADYNRRFAEARKRFPGLSRELFNDFLCTAVNDLVTAVSESWPDRADAVAAAAFDAGLELAGQNLAGPGSRHPFVEEGWKKIFPIAFARLAEDPVSLIPSISNALYGLSVTPGARPAQWIDDIVKVSASCPDAGSFLRAGQVAAWKAGMAHFRKSALGVLGTLPEGVVRLLLNLPPAASWDAVRDRLARDPWFDPSHMPDHAGRMRIAFHAGAFRGFGGLFVEPPVVAASGDDFFVSSGKETWLLVADLYGATFHHALPGEADAARKNILAASDLDISGSIVKNRNSKLDLSGLGAITSYACTGNTLAVASKLSHSITIVALP